MTILFVMVLVLAVGYLFADDETPNTFVIEKETGLVVALVWVNWKKSPNGTPSGKLQVEYPNDLFTYIECCDATFSKYNVHIYNRD